MKDKLAVAVATWFYSGLIPPFITPGMAGTYGSLFSLPLCYPLVRFCWNNLKSGSVVYVVAATLIMIVGISSIRRAEVALGSRIDWKLRRRTRDQNQIVIDEVLGMLFACVPIAFYPGAPWWLFAVAFGAFRAFDIKKPWPANRLDRIESAWGVMLDDVAAGLWAGVVVWLLLQWRTDMFEALMFPAAAALYTWAIIGEHVQKTLKLWAVRMFAVAVLIDASATILVCVIRTGTSVWPTTLHGWLGYLALWIMLIHGIWAYQAFARQGKALARFHRWSPWAGALWLAAFLSGIPR